MSETVPQEWPEVALSYLDALWSGDTHMAVIRKKLMPLLGFYPMAADVIAMARRYQEKPVKVAPASLPVPIVIPVSVMLGFVPPPKTDNAVRRVPPGTYPARGFSMLGGKSR